jgi:(p)ppGpp synthase/HD superfamily hydrolase
VNGLPDRDRAMTARVLREARARGIADEGDGPLGRALELAMEVRRVALADDHDPAYLHPGRTVLILLQDTPERDPGHLAAAALVESEEPALRVAVREIHDIVGQEVADLAAGVPIPPGEDLLERLLEVPSEVARIALAERLDHLRHLHLEADPARRIRMHREAEEIYAPLAGRVDPVLARRYAWWCRMFAGRHLPGG